GRVMDYLFKPVKIGNMEVKNRIAMPAMHLGYCLFGGLVSDKIIKFYQRRAEGGAGLIFVGGCGIDEYRYPTMISADSDEFIPGLSKLASVVKDGGAKVAAQIFHPGRYAQSAYASKLGMAPSPVFSRMTGETPREMTAEDIGRTIDAFASAAGRVKKAGFDAVEIIGSAGYLICQFLSPLTNRREDEYGGDFDNRMKFGLEVLKSVREAVGPDYPVLFRVSGNEFMEGGSSRDEIIRFCLELERGGVDAINVTGGWHETNVPQITMAVPNGAFVYLAESIKDAVNVPVIACNRINDPSMAEDILRRGQADMVGFARSLIADPDLPLKARSGRGNTIRKCIACNQGCLDAIFTGSALECLVNPEAGREAKGGPKMASESKKVLVVGGGPAGMEAARVASLRGHKVTLWESKERLGGQLLLAAIPPGRGEFKRIVDFYEAILKEQKVKVALNKKACKETIAEENPDLVVNATGALPLTPDIEGIDGVNVLNAWDVLGGTPVNGRKVVVIGGGAVGCETALHLARDGALSQEALHFLFTTGAEDPQTLFNLAVKGNKDVTLIEKTSKLGRDIGTSTRWTILQDIRKSQVSVVTKAEVVKIEDGQLVVNKDGEEKIFEADTVIVALGSVANNSLKEELEKWGGKVYAVGDTVKPRKALEAIREGYEVGLKI
ncbi:MAG TPA: FAD-dependent oxidoreductase, partial [Clostridia bacterium]|nr:FAD-dependent oxidoreductase [Clostridia bacterium]